MASGANRGAYYAGFPALLQEAGIDFELMAGVSAGGCPGRTTALFRPFQPAGAQ